MKTTTKQTHLYSNTDLRKLLIPIIIEQLLSSLMGTVDTMMVSNVGSAAISAVSLVDSINILVIQALSALAAGGAIVCAQYIGQKNVKRANESARQVLFIITAISVVISLICLVFQKPMLRLIFGSVEAEDQHCISCNVHHIGYHGNEHRTFRIILCPENRCCRIIS